ncbi:MAG: hypothetical protein ACF8XB_18705 [Planctomycetota bacterium JB042]
MGLVAVARGAAARRSVVRSRKPPLNRPYLAAGLVAALLPLVSPSAEAAVVPDAGYSVHAVPAAPAGAFPGGLDVLPNGHVAVFDGQAIVELDPSTGAVVQTLYTPPASVFGSFVRTDPTGTFLLFGESSAGTITRVPLDGSPTSVVATIAFNNDCAFDAVGAAYVSASPSFVTTQVYRVDLGSGGTDLILDMPGPSGPIAFDATNALYYADADPSFPPTAGAQSVFRFSSAKLVAATGPAHLTAADGAPFVTGLTSVPDLAFDGRGDLLLADDGELREYDAGGNPKRTVGAEAPFHAITALAFAAGAGDATYDAFQPADGGTLFALSSDFFSFNDLNVVEPAPATLAITPANPIPAGPLSLDVADAPANGMALLLVATQPLPSNVTVHAGLVPLSVGVDLGTLLGAVFLPLDAQGALTLPASNPGGPATFATQAIVLDGTTPVGTTNTAVAIFR